MAYTISYRGIADAHLNHSCSISILLELAPVDNFTLFDRAFYKRPTLTVAKELLGAILCRRLQDGTVLTAPIVEVEAYTEDDPACHAFRGLTERTRVMFGHPGHAYVYFIYGMYFCLNVVTEPEHTPGAVLIRAIGTPGGDGPGKLCRLWGIDKSQNGLNLCDLQSELFICKGDKVSKSDIEVSTRIGIKLAAERPWRFYLKGHPHVSGAKRSSAKVVSAKAVPHKESSAKESSAQGSTSKGSPSKRSVSGGSPSKRSTIKGSPSEGSPGKRSPSKGSSNKGSAPAGAGLKKSDAGDK